MLAQNLKPVSFKTSVSSNAGAAISTAWRDTTKTKYNSTFKRWTNFCSKGSINSLQSNTVNVIEFLTEETKFLNSKKFCRIIHLFQVYLLWVIVSHMIL